MVRRSEFYNKGFSSPNTSYRLLERPLKVVTLGSLGTTQDGLSKIGGHTHYTAIRLKIPVSLLRKVVESSTTNLNCSKSSYLVGRSTVVRVSDLNFLSYWATPIFCGPMRPGHKMKNISFKLI